MRHLILVLSLLLIISCAGDTTRFHFGLYTSRVFGEIKLQNKIDSNILIFAEYELQTFMSDQDYEILQKKTDLKTLSPSESKFEFKFPEDAKRVSILVIAENHKPEMVSFQQSIGIGEIEYTPVLEQDPRWRDNYFFNIKPLITGYLKKEDKRMIQINQLKIGKWISVVEEKI